MEMKMPGLTTGPVGPVIGILGYDVFRRAVVEMRSVEEDSQPSPEPVEQPTPNYIVSLYDIDQFYKMPLASNLDWMKLHMVLKLMMFCLDSAFCRSRICLMWKLGSPSMDRKSCKGYS